MRYYQSFQKGYKPLVTQKKREREDSKSEVRKRKKEKK